MVDKDLILLSELLDNRFKGPFGLRFGLDSIIGLIPMFGDLFTSLVSLYIVLRCALKGYPLVVLIKMVLNILIEYLIGLLPFIGNVFDFYWKSNLKNVALAKNFQLNTKKETQKASFMLIAILTGLFLVFIGLILSTFYLFGFLFHLIFS